MGLVVSLAGLVMLVVFAAIERALLTLQEAVLSDNEDETSIPALLPARVVNGVGAARLATLLGIGLAAWGWYSWLSTSYHILRDSLGLSRIEATSLVIWLPCVVFAALIAWIGHSTGQAHFQRIAKSGFSRALLLPFLPLQYVLTAIAKRLGGTPATQPEEQLRALSGSPDVFWQMVQDQTGGDMAPVNRQMFDKASELQTIRVRACMTFRTDIVAIEENQGIEGLRTACLGSGYSKIPVYKDNLDTMIGYCHSSGLFKKPEHLEDILSDILTVPESMTASQLLVEFNKAQKSMAVVIDEYGSTSGVVTMEDVMEEIFGEIEDELDEQTETEVKEGDNTWLLSARLEVDYLNDSYGWDLPTGDYESLGGLVVHLHQDLPEQGDIIEASPFTFEVVGMEQTRITLLRLTFMP